jgi:hypothetical protein
MKPKLLLCLALVLSGVLTGCVMQREFRGSATNLKNDGGQTSISNDLKMTVAGSGITMNGGKYIVFSLPEENCRLVLFYPKLKPDYYLRAELGTNQIHAWQIMYGCYSTNGFTVREELPQNQTDAWLVRGKQPRSSELASGVMGSLPANAERLQGQVEMVTDSKNREFHMNVDLSGDNRVKLLGIFDSYKTLWSPLILPFVLIHGDSD